MIQDIMPGTEEKLMEGPTAAYVGIDPTADSLHIGHLVSVMILKHFQNCGHKPFALVGGATGMIGDPSMKSQERNLLDEETLAHNVACIKKQLSRFLDMMAKDSVKKRLSSESREGMSFTEFTYQLLQGYDYLWLYEHKGCTLQMGGSDQWGNITTGSELIRRILGKEAYALTCPLITKADGGKFGKTEKGNIWLDPERTSPYQFYQFWLNVSDEDAARYIKIFTMLSREEIEAAIAEHAEAPHMRKLQKLLAKEITVMVHGESEYNNAVAASEMLFGNATSDALKKLDEKTFLQVFEGVPTFEVAADRLPMNILELLAVETSIFPSKGECRKMVQAGGVSIDKEKVSDINASIGSESVLNGKYILAQKGKKNYFIIKLK